LLGRPYHRRSCSHCLRLLAGVPGAEKLGGVSVNKEHAMYDMKNLTRLKKLDANAPDVMKSFWAFDKAVFVDGAPTTLQKQLIAVAVALTTQCPYCIEIHAKEARKAATDAHLSEAAMVAAALRAGGTVTHASHLFGD
jgi:AhpD family alkylhydroperoxidase